MTIRSESGPEATFLDAQSQGRVMFFQGETELTVEGFTFMRGVGPPTGNFVGGGFAAHLSSPILRDCIFRNNSGSQGGAYWYGGVGAPPSGTSGHGRRSMRHVALLKPPWFSTVRRRRCGSGWRTA